MARPLSTHDERQSAYRGDGPDTDITGHGRDDPSAPLPESGAGEGFYPRGHGKGGHLGEGEPDGQPQRDGSTQPDFGQSGSYGQAGDVAAHTPGRRDAGRGEGDEGEAE